MLTQVEQDINRKIAVEQNIIQGATNLKKKTDNVMVIQKCNTNIREARQNIEYLQDTLNKLRLNDQKHPNDDVNTQDTNKEYGYLSTISPNEHIFSRLDLIKYDCPSLAQRIRYMLQQMEFKLQVEKQYQEANTKLTKLYQIDGDQRSSSAAEGGAVESKHRILMLKKALKKYQAVNVDLDQYKHHSDDSINSSQPKFRRKQLTGVLTIGLTAIRDVDHIQSPMFARKPDSYITVKIDDTIKARSKPSRNDRWHEEFEIQVGKGNEVEITVYDKVNDQMIPVAVMWLLLSDIAEEIRKKKANQTTGQQGWVNASNIESNTGSQNENSVVSASTALPENSPVPEGIPSNAHVTTNQWFILEPAGQILLTLGFRKTQQRKNAVGGLHRHGAIINRQEEIYEQHGHHFVQKSFYNIMCCAYCGDFLRYSGFQCQDCKFLCHKKCYTNVVTKCIAKTSNDTDPDEAKLNHRIPHRFEPASNRGTKWCCHCGFILPWGKQKVRKCSECGIMCHAQCSHLVPDFCGMSMEMANQILKTIQDTKKTQQRKKKAPAPVTSGSSITAVDTNAPTRSPKRLEARQSQTVSDLTQSSPRSNRNSNDISGLHQHDKAFELSPQKRTEPGQRVNDYIEQNNAYLNFTANAPSGGSPEVGRDRTLDPSISNRSSSNVPGVRNSRLFETDQNDITSMEKDKLYREEAELWKQQRQDMEQEMEQEMEEVNAIQNNNQYYGPDYQVQDSQPTELDTFIQSEIIPAQHDADTTIETNHSNPFRDMNDKTFELEQQHVSEMFSEDQIMDDPEQLRPKSTQLSFQKSASGKHKKKSNKRRKVSLDNFALLKVLGKGNFGKVILSRSKNTGRLCAIKVLKKDNIIQNHDIESARAEKKVFLLATKTKHPFLTNLYCSFQTENRIYFAMEFIGGGDLMWHVQNQRLSVRRAKFYAAEVLLALKYFHDNGVIYRDLKLENILLTPQGHIKIADYGLCKDEMWFGNKTSTFCGTPEFMAPEILKDQEYSRAVDWWAFGVLLYQMLLCQSPFSGDDEDEVFNAILTDEPLYPIDMAGDIVQIFQGLLTKDPEKRLGAGSRDALEVMEEPFFRNINFDDILSLKVKPPYIPEIKSEEDTSYFEQEFTTAPPTLTPLPSVLTTKQQEEFRGFSFMPDDLDL